MPYTDDDFEDIDDRDGELSADTYEEIEALACLDGPKSECSGPVEYRMALSATGKSFPRCEKHWAQRLDEQDRINRMYPEQPPSDWSPLDAGEYWDED